MADNEIPTLNGDVLSQIQTFIDTTMSVGVFPLSLADVLPYLRRLEQSPGAFLPRSAPLTGAREGVNHRRCGGVAGDESAGAWWMGS